MYIEQLVGKRLADAPKDALTPGHVMLLRGGYIRQIGQGIFALLPLGLRVAKKVEAIIREEMNAIGGQEVQMPVVSPADLWIESGRYEAVAPVRAEHDARGSRRRDRPLASRQLPAVPVHALPDSDEVPRRSAQPRRIDSRARVCDEGRLFLPSHAGRPCGVLPRGPRCLHPDFPPQWNAQLRRYRIRHRHDGRVGCARVYAHHARGRRHVDPLPGMWLSRESRSGRLQPRV